MTMVNSGLKGLKGQPRSTKYVYAFIQCWTNAVDVDVGPALYKWYRNILCVLGRGVIFYFVCAVEKKHGRLLNIPF